MSVLEDAELAFVTGKGGVGKTTVALATALAAARDGRRMVALRGRPGRRAPPVSTAPTPPRPGREVELDDGLWATTIDPVVALEEWAGAPDRLAPARRAADALQRLRGLRRRRSGRPRAGGDHQGVGARPPRALGQGRGRLRPRGRRRAGQRPRRRDAAHPADVRRDRPRRADRVAGAQGRSTLLEDPARSAVVAVALPEPSCPSRRRSTSRSACAGAVGRATRRRRRQRRAAAALQRRRGRAAAWPATARSPRAGGRRGAPPARAGQRPAGPAAPPAPPHQRARDHAALRGRTAPRAGRGADARRRAGAAARLASSAAAVPGMCAGRGCRAPHAEGVAVPLAPHPSAGGDPAPRNACRRVRGVVESAIYAHRLARRAGDAGGAAAASRPDGRAALGAPGPSRSARAARRPLARSSNAQLARHHR